MNSIPTKIVLRILSSTFLLTDYSQMRDHIYYIYAHNLLQLTRGEVLTHLPLYVLPDHKTHILPRHSF